ncbi:MAG TPA: hypothetical protein DEA08_35930, partial [Planctomycetes bacterium]|nr:hypothetical protein [Planctomycetota bacterium]
YENLPIISWLVILRGRCAGCAQPISARYPSVELVVTLAFMFLAWRDLVGRWDQPEAWAIYAVHTTFACAILACALIDYDLEVIPDAIDLPGTVLGLIAVTAIPALLGPRLPQLAAWSAQATLALESPLAWWGLPASLLAPLEWVVDLSLRRPTTYPHLCGLAGGMLGAAVGAGFLWVFGRICSRLVGREALGLGDVKFMAMVGALTGWQGALTTILLGSLAGASLGLSSMLIGALPGRERGAGMTSTLRFGPFLAGGAAVAAFLPGRVLG